MNTIKRLRVNGFPDEGAVHKNMAGDTLQRPSFPNALMIIFCLHLFAIVAMYSFEVFKLAKDSRYTGISNHNIDQEWLFDHFQPMPSAGATGAIQTKVSTKNERITAPPSIQIQQPISSSTEVVPRVATTAQEEAEKQTTPDLATALHEVKIAATSGEYLLVGGDTLYSVAKRFHVSYQELAELNRINDPRKLTVGQKLKLPIAKISPR